MATFAEYEILEEVYRGPLGAVLRRRLPGQARDFAIKVFDPAMMGLLEADSATQAFLDRSGLQKAMVERGAGYWSRLHELIATPEGAYYVEDYFPLTAQKLVGGLRGAGAKSLHHVVTSVVKGLLELRMRHRRADGNLKPSNVMIAGTAEALAERPADVRVLLTDVATEGEGPEARAGDLRALGDLIHQLVLHRPFQNGAAAGGAGPGEAAWPLRQSPEWARLGRDAARWRELCNWLLTPAEASGGPRELEEVVAVLRELTPRRRPVPKRRVLAVLAVPVVLLGLAIAGAVVFGRIHDTARKELAEQNSQWFGAWSRRCPTPPGGRRSGPTRTCGRSSTSWTAPTPSTSPSTRPPTRASASTVTGGRARPSNGCSGSARTSPRNIGSGSARRSRCRSASRSATGTSRRRSCPTSSAARSPPPASTWRRGLTGSCSSSPALRPAPPRSNRCGSGSPPTSRSWTRAATSCCWRSPTTSGRRRGARAVQRRRRRRGQRRAVAAPAGRPARDRHRQRLAQRLCPRSVRPLRRVVDQHGPPAGEGDQGVARRGGRLRARAARRKVEAARVARRRLQEPGDRGRPAGVHAGAAGGLRGGPGAVAVQAAGVSGRAIPEKGRGVQPGGGGAAVVCAAARDRRAPQAVGQPQRPGAVGRVGGRDAADRFGGAEPAPGASGSSGSTRKRTRWTPTRPPTRRRRRRPRR